MSTINNTLGQKQPGENVHILRKVNYKTHHTLLTQWMYSTVDETNVGYDVVPMESDKCFQSPSFMTKDGGQNVTERIRR